jgi:hypothetical protein
MSIHYALRPEVDKSTFLGGVLAAGDTSIDVLEELKTGGGVIVIADDDHLKGAVLDGYLPLQRVSAPESPSADTASEPEAPAPIVATDGDPIEIPDGVVPGETPGWPVDDAGRPLRLTDEQRKKLAETPLDKQPETVRELLQGVGITPPPDTGRAVRRSTLSEKES